VIWFIGLSALAKSTIAQNVEKWLYNLGCSKSVLDGNNVRPDLCGDLDLSAEECTQYAKFNEHVN